MQPALYKACTPNPTTHLKAGVHREGGRRTSRSCQKPQGFLSFLTSGGHHWWQQEYKTVSQDIVKPDQSWEPVMELTYILPEHQQKALVVQKVLGGNSSWNSTFYTEMAFEATFSDMYRPRMGEKGLMSPLMQRTLKILKIFCSFCIYKTCFFFISRWLRRRKLGQYVISDSPTLGNTKPKKIYIKGNQD